MITFRTWSALWAVQAVPDEQLLIETDAPFLAPVPFRGRRNEPAYVVETARAIGELHGRSGEEIGRITAANFKRLFHLDSSTK